MLTDLGPQRQQDALALVVTGAVGVGLAEVTGDDGTFDRAHDLGHGDGPRTPRQDVAAADTPLGADQAGALEGEQDLLQIGLGEGGALRDVADRGGLALARMQRQ